MDRVDRDVVVVGGGQSGLAIGYYLRREKLEFEILDAQEGPGGAWRHGWDSLRLFSPADSSSLPGWMMPRGDEEYPDRDHVLNYLEAYEARYALPVRRPVRVHEVHRTRGGFRLVTSAGERTARVLISATGTWEGARYPRLAGREEFAGRELHSAEYTGPEPFRGMRVVVVGGGNSGAQIVADLDEVAAGVRWLTRDPPVFLPDDVDGRDLFQEASARYRARQEGRPVPPSRSLGDIVMVRSVRKARDLGHMSAEPLPDRFAPDGLRRPDGTLIPADAVIWATGFAPALDHLEPLGVADERGRIATEGTRSLECPGLWLVGYGAWTGYASATLIGVGRTARRTAAEVADFLRSWDAADEDPTESAGV